MISTQSRVVVFDLRGKLGGKPLLPEPTSSLFHLRSLLRWEVRSEPKRILAAAGECTSKRFGMFAADGMIVWIGDETQRLQRAQASLLGLESTAGADVDVTFGDFQPGALGTEWPRYFNERVRRPFDVQAHEWRMTNLQVCR